MHGEKSIAVALVGLLLAPGAAVARAQEDSTPAYKTVLTPISFPG